MMEEGSRTSIVFVVEGSNDGRSEWYVVGGIVVGVIMVVILLLILLVVLIACKPWRYFRSSTHSHRVPSKVDDLERPLIPDDVETSSDEVYSSARAYNLEGPGFQDDGYLRPPRIAGHIHKQRLPVSSPRFNQGVSVVVDTPNPAESICVGQTLKRSFGSCPSLDKQKVSRREDLGVNSEVVFDIERPGDVVIKDSGDQKMQGAALPWRSFPALLRGHDTRCSQLILLGYH